MGLLVILSHNNKEEKQMIRISSFHYKQGIESRNRFMEMLHDAIKIALGGVRIMGGNFFFLAGLSNKKVFRAER